MKQMIWRRDMSEINDKNTHTSHAPILWFVSSDRSSYSDDGLLYIRSSGSHFFRFSLQSIDAIDVTSVTQSCLNSINAIDVTRC